MFQVHDAIKDLPGSTAARELLVTTALEYLNTLAAEAGGDRELQQDLAAAYEKVGDIQGQAYGQANVGEPRLALDSYAKAIALLEPIVAADPARSRMAARWRRATCGAAVVVRPGRIRRSSGRVAEQWPSKRSRSTTGQRHARTLADAYSSHAYTVDEAGNIPGGQNDAGVVYARKAVAILEDLARERPDDVDLAYKLAKAYSSLAITVLGDVPRPETMQESLAFHRKALESTRGSSLRPGQTQVRARSAPRQDERRFDLNEMADYRGAVENARAGQPLLASLRTDANNTQVRVDSANLAWPLGRALLALGEVDEARKVFEQHEAVLAELAAESDTLKCSTCGTMARVAPKSIRGRIGLAPGS